MPFTETQLLCPTCKEPATLPIHPAQCACGWTGSVADLVTGIRTRHRQFSTYPTPMPFTRQVA